MVDIIENKFKKKLLLGEKQIGAWNTICTGSVSELFGYAGFDWVVIVVVVEMFTTDGINFSAKSANDTGIF